VQKGAQKRQFELWMPPFRRFLAFKVNTIQRENSVELISMAHFNGKVPLYDNCQLDKSGAYTVFLFSARNAKKLKLLIYTPKLVPPERFELPTY